MDSDSVSADYSISTEILEKIVSSDTIETANESVETEGLYHCGKCGQNFPDSNIFSSHTCRVSPSASCIPRVLASEGHREKGDSDVYKCPRCDEVFQLPSTLKRHFRTHPVEPKRPVLCSEPGCQFRSEDLQVYQKHLRREHHLQLVPCAFRSCCLAFRSEEEMERHRRNHLPFHCAHCHYVTANAKQFSAHCRSHAHPGAGEERREADGTGETEARSRGAEHSRRSVAGTRRRRQTHTPQTTPSESQDEEEQHSSKKARKEKQREEAAASTDLKDHLSKCHVAEGTEHLYRTHICPECRRCFKKRTHLLEHLHLHFPDPGLQCPRCQHYFTSKSKLRIHMLREAGSKLHQCHLCSYCAVERNSLRRHLASIHGEQVQDNFYSDVYPCPTCGKSFRLSQALKAHMKSHHTSPAGQPLGCFQEGCPFQSTNKKELQRHAMDAHGVKAVECRHHACSVYFGSQEAMEVHYRTHLAFHCSQCDFSSSNKSSFQRHKRQGHPGSEELRCGFCPFTSFNPVEFEEHVGRLHANEKIHRCPQCSFVTAHKRVLGRHMLLHTGEKPHKCKLCSFRCRDETYLSKHMLTHSDDKNHMCSECGYVTKWKHYLNVHMRKHAGDLRYQCTQCSYRCHRADQLSSHKLRHQEKSLMCEVCAFSCKRKYELRKHMQLKHSEGGGHQLPVFQCKYCTYHTQYRQALHNHENCKHTRHRQFCCALCSYSSFSSTSLFLHKRKVHGYVPGDKEWLHNYAQKERENSAVMMTQSFCQAPPPERARTPEGVSHHPAETSQSAKGAGCGLSSASASRDPGSQVTPAEAATEEASVESVEKQCGSDLVSQEVSEESVEKQCGSDLVSQEASLTEVPTNHKTSVPEECCTLVLTPMTNILCAGSVCMQNEPENEGQTTSGRPSVGSRLLPGERVRPGQLSQRVSDAGEDGASAGDCAELSDEEGVTKETASKSRLQAEAQGTDGTAREEGNETEEASRPESLLKALKKQDREQAEALVLEGRVQVLVVQTKACLYRCDRCSYVTRKQASLSQHCKSSCRARRVPLRCQDCGAEFKQQRGLDTHQRRKCPVLLRKSRRFPSLPAVSSATDTPANQGEAVTENNQSESISKSNSTGEPAAEKMPSCSPLGRTITAEKQRESSVPEHQTVKENATAVKNSQTNSVQTSEPGRAAETSTAGDTHSYVTQDGKFRCSKCSFSSCRLTTIERHCSACTRLTSRRQAGQRSQQHTRTAEPEEEDESDEDFGDEDESEDDANETVEPKKPVGRFSCHSCPFVCHQKRALLSHQKRGCLRLGEVQCQFCAFVAKSQDALQHHVAVHGKKRPVSAPQGAKTRLRCELCPFTCKQARCLAHHVALKHEGAKPHSCRFCGFSTKRRYRLEAHESLHTGVGRHCCELCAQTFGTTSKLRLHRQRVHDRRPSHFCSLCDYSGYSRNDVSRHTLSCHTGALSHACSLCSARFSSDTALKQHCLRKHQDPPCLPCPSCPFSCRSRASLRAHQQLQHPQLDCPTCHAAFQSRESLEEHRRSHLAHKCPVCPFAARERQALAQHLLEEHEEGGSEERPLKCAACGFSCRFQLVFEQHVRSHGGARLYRCTDCQYSTRNRQKITWHIRIHTGEKPYRCDRCSYTCADPSRLKYHMRIHQEERKYLCPECGYKCKWVNQLKYHMTKHTGAKPYACEECEYRTNRADALRVHRETRHRDARSFICEKCGKAFKTRFLLKTHQRKHSEERPFVCRLCGRAFRWPAGLRHHFLTHTQQQPFHCLLCSYRAKQRFQVIKHLQRHHPEQPAEQGVGRDPGPHTVSLQEARLGGAGEAQPGGEQEVQEIQQEAGETA
ncbi:zinc finger protein 142 [Megalops cyprinoides]|uniref:zinc finger protein 142 n=1 Tax=Megalops cyprinoides TaxID=118141 RepID=UPI001863A0EE|nr:zinc finger protein 142 [Megalops cyprinoides]